MKKIIALILAALMVISMAACGADRSSGPDLPDPAAQTGTDTQIEDPGTAAPPEQAEPEPEKISLTFNMDEWPVVDGATAFLPFYQEMTARMLGISSEEAAQHLLCSTTDYAYPYLWRGQVDIIFCLRPSQDQITSAMEENNVVFEEVPFANEGFVFFVNKNNPVDSLTVKQLHDIYAGKITNWKQVGGNDQEIIAYQRTEGSGSQTGLYLHVIDQDEVVEPPTEKRVGTMGGIIDAVAGYDNSEGALGYSYRYFVTNMHYDEQIKMLKIEGVYPDYESIADGSYPLISDVCAVYREDEPADSAARKIAAWCASSQGAMLAKELGYVPTQEALGTLYKPEPNSPDDVVIDYAQGNPCPECTVMHTYFTNNLEVQEITVEEGDFYASYPYITGLKNKQIERQINNLIEDKFYELYEKDLPAYPGVRTRLAMFDGIEDVTTYGYCSAYVQGSFNNILSVMFNKSINKYVYSDDYYDDLYVVDNDTLNIDLNTGKEIYIGDLFADNVDGIAYINDLIAAESDKPEAFDEPPLYWYDESGDTPIRFRRAFTGINKNQKYYLSSYDGSLQIVLDYENPEIATQYSPVIYAVPMLGINAYESRFMGEESLFSDETPSPCLFEVHYDETGATVHSDYIEDWIPEYHVSLSIDATTYEEMSFGVIAQLDPEFGRIDSLKDYVTDRYAELQKMYGSDLNASASFYSYASRFGNYINTYASTGFWCSDSDWNYLDDYNEEQKLCFAKGEDNPIGLDELFTPDCDMYEVMENAVVKNVIDLLGDWNGTDAYVAVFREMITSLRGFTVSSDAIYLDCPTINDIIDTYLPYESDNWEVSGRFTYLNYRDLGMENLTIFD